MNGQLIDGISIQASFARRQNQDNFTQSQQWKQPFVSAGFTQNSNFKTQSIPPEPIQRR